MIEIVVNGNSREIAAGTSVLALLEALGLRPERVAVELNRSIVKTAAWSGTTLEAGAKVEIVHFVGGGAK
ncbi:MAG: sulfur carrier protein ThiS [Acidobacteria bacterium]|nr:sulfur carrier protein ThiS [Acidobacteriota bacterium]